MNIIVFGATGFVGSEVVREALKQNHVVTAFARKADMLNKQNNLIPFKGDVLIYSDVQKAIKSQSVSIICLSSPNKKGSNTFSEGTKNIISAMKEENITRLICLSSAGVLGNDTDFFFTKIIVPLTLRHAFKDKRIQYDIITNSNMDWTIVRPVEIIPKDLGSEIEVTYNKSRASKIGVNSVARFMINQVEDNSNIKKSPIISTKV